MPSVSDITAIPDILNIIAIPADCPFEQRRKWLFLPVVHVVSAAATVPPLHAVPAVSSLPSPYPGDDPTTLCSDGIGCSTDFVLIPHRYLHSTQLN